MEAEKEWLAEDGVDDAGTISVNTDIESNTETIYPARNIKIDSANSARTVRLF